MGIKIKKLFHFNWLFLCAVRSNSLQFGRQSGWAVTTAASAIALWRWWRSCSRWETERGRERQRESEKDIERAENTVHTYCMNYKRTSANASHCHKCLGHLLPPLIIGFPLFFDYFCWLLNFTCGLDYRCNNRWNHLVYWCDDVQCVWMVSWAHWPVPRYKDRCGPRWEWCHNWKFKIKLHIWGHGGSVSQCPMFDYRPFDIECKASMKLILFCMVKKWWRIIRAYKPDTSTAVARFLWKI